MSLVATGTTEILNTQTDIQALGTMLDPLARIGNHEVTPKIIELTQNGQGIRISTLPLLHEPADTTYLFIDCFAGTHKEGRVYLEGTRIEHDNDERVWKTIARPLSREPADEQMLGLITTYVSPFATWWASLGTVGQQQAFDQTLRESIAAIESRPKRIANMFAWLTQ